MNIRSSSSRWMLGLGLLCAACASTPRKEAQTTPRVKDSAPEKIAAQRAAANNLGLEADDQRWGIEAAQQRKRERAQQAAQPQAQQPLPKGPVDLQKQTPASP